MNNNLFKGKNGPLLIAEIGGNHEGDFEYAKKLTSLAVSTEVDYVKFQLYTGDTLVSRIEGEARNVHFKRFELKKEEHIELASMVLEAGKGYMASVWDVGMMEWIDPFMKIYKIGSGDITAYPIIRKIVEKGKPIILSTGLCTEIEVLDAVKYIQGLDNSYLKQEKLALLQCTSMYPIPDSDANLCVMARLKELTNLTVGYSDHTIGLNALITSVAMGAEILEFHFTDEKEGKTFRDHKVSLTVDDINKLITEINTIHLLQGSSNKNPTKSEIENNHIDSFRRAVYPARDIEAGTIISENDLICLRPNHGIDAREIDKVIGKKTNINLKKHEKLDWSYFI